MNMADFKPQHFNWRASDGVATITLNRPERKNPITFESYAELGDPRSRLSLLDHRYLLTLSTHTPNDHRTSRGLRAASQR